LLLDCICIFAVMMLYRRAVDEKMRQNRKHQPSFVGFSTGGSSPGSSSGKSGKPKSREPAASVRAKKASAVGKDLNVMSPSVNIPDFWSSRPTEVMLDAVVGTQASSPASTDGHISVEMSAMEK